MSLITSHGFICLCVWMEGKRNGQCEKVAIQSYLVYEVSMKIIDLSFPSHSIHFALSSSIHISFVCVSPLKLDPTHSYNLHLSFFFSPGVTLSLQLSVKILFHQPSSAHTAQTHFAHTHTHSHYVKRCGPLDGRQCNQLIKSCFDHQHQSALAWRAPETSVCDVLQSVWPSQWTMSCDLDTCVSPHLSSAALCYYSAMGSWETSIALRTKTKWNLHPLNYQPHKKFYLNLN